MTWIARNSALNQAEMENNALILTENYRARGIADATISAILGNAQAESTINPERQEVGLGTGYGIFQWTPQTKLITYCVMLGLLDYTDGYNQLEVLYRQLLGDGLPYDFNTSQTNVNNYKPSGATDKMVGVTSQQFFDNSINFTIEELTILFMLAYERPSYNPNTNHISSRISYTQFWFEFIGGIVPPVKQRRTKNVFPLLYKMYLKR